MKASVPYRSEVGNMKRCRHPSILRRVIGRLNFLHPVFVNALDRWGKLLQKIANTIRFESFWSEKVFSDERVTVLPSFQKAKSKHPIWKIASEKVSQLGNSGSVIEFGTNNGGSLLWFQKHLPEGMLLHGLDCFTGLPEEWDGLPKHSIRGFGGPLVLWDDDPCMQKKVADSISSGHGFPAPPQPNIKIHAGFFSDTIHGVMSSCGHPPTTLRLIHFDADIYMSTRPMLEILCGLIKYKYYILFDEFYSANHEFRAWHEFIELYDIRDWRVVATSEDGVQVLVEVNTEAEPAPDEPG
jgi:hypothetical protein